MIALGNEHLDWLMIRQALSLSLYTEKPCRITGGFSWLMENPAFRGLMSDFENLFAETGFGSLTVEGEDVLCVPAPGRFGNFRFATHQQSSAIEVLLLLLPLLSAQEFRSKLEVRGVTHSGLSHPTSFIKETLLEILEKMGFFASCTLRRFGFTGSLGGEIESRIYPAEMTKIDNPGRVDITGIIGARVYISGLDTIHAEKEKAVLKEKIGVPEGSISIMQVIDADGPGNIVEVYYGTSLVPVVISYMVTVHDSEGTMVFNDDAVEAAMNELAHRCNNFRMKKLVPETLFREILPYAVLTGSPVEIPRGYQKAAETLSLIEDFLP
jgi:RNA 3'-terminal phosphate cyclase